MDWDLGGKGVEPKPGWPMERLFIGGDKTKEVRC